MSQDVTLNIPSELGSYWYYVDSIHDFRQCEVVEYQGTMALRFIDGSIQKCVNKQSYLVGPIAKPLIGPNGDVRDSHRELELSVQKFRDTKTAGSIYRMFDLLPTPLVAKP